MTETDVITVFATKIKNGSIDLGGGVTVEIEVFATLFADAPSNPTYDNLMRIDDERMGYKPFFDRCKAEGILS